MTSLDLSSPPMLAVLLVLSTVVGALVTWFSIRLAHRYGLQAVPDHRSSHEIPTPQLGGVGVATAVLPLLALMLVWRWGYPLQDGWPGGSVPRLLLLTAGAILYFALGLADDLRGVRPASKLLGQILGAAALLPVIWETAEVAGLDGTSRTLVLAGWTGLWMLWCVGFVNAYNFMDGMNGKAGVFSVVVLVFLEILLLQPGGVSESSSLLRRTADLPEAVHLPLVATMIGGLAGFLLFNCRPRALVFLGDTGSHFLGYLLAALLFLGAENVVGPGPSLVACLILLMPFIYDVAFTLVKRLLQGKRLWEAHREHLYQRLMLCGFSHMRILAVCSLTYIACGLLALGAARSHTAVESMLWLLGALAVMVGYTAFVLSSERAAARRGKQQFVDKA